MELEDIDGGLHPAVDEQSPDEDEDSLDKVDLTHVSAILHTANLGKQHSICGDTFFLQEKQPNKRLLKSSVLSDSSACFNFKF